MEQSKNDYEYIMRDTDATGARFPDELVFTVESTGESVVVHKTKVVVGSYQSVCDYVINKQYISRTHAVFSYEDERWFLEDAYSTNGTWINGNKIEAGKKYQLVANDVINFANQEKLIFYSTNNAEVSEEENDDEKARIVLEAGIRVFAQLEYKDEFSLRVIITGLLRAPLYFPVEIDMAAMFGDVDPLSLKRGDIISPQQDVKCRILTLGVQDGSEVIPMFTSKQHMGKNQSVSVIRYYPSDYLPILIKMDKIAIINPFSDYRFILEKDLMILLDSELNGNNSDLEVREKKATDLKLLLSNLVGSVIANKYKVDKILEENECFVTCLGKEIETDIRYTMEFCFADKNHNSVRALLRNKADILAKLNHPAIPKLKELIETDDYCCLIFERAKGRTLNKIVEKSGAMKFKKVIKIGKSLAEVLQYLHCFQPPYIYRDMRPQIVRIDSTGQVKLIDIAIMREYKPDVLADTVYLGTRGYAAPEQFGGMGQTDARTDIFNLGMTMYYLVTGISPETPSFNPEPICKIDSSLPKGLEYIIGKCIELNPDNRYQNCQELIDDLNQYEFLPKPKGLFGSFGFFKNK